MPLQATSGAASYDGFGGGVVAEPNYIESCFSTYLYTGTGADRSISNGIDLSTKGGLVWIKNRTPNAESHNLFDTARGALKYLFSNLTNAQSTGTNGVSAFNADGFSLLGASGSNNYLNTTYVSWTFRKQPKFFDIVTYTGNGVTTGRTIAHSLNSAVGALFVKCTSNPSDWPMWHNTFTSLQGMYLNTTGGKTVNTFESKFGNGTTVVAPTSTVFTVGGDNNGTGKTYVAYLFAHDAGGFGLTGTDNVISCGSFTTDGSGVADVTLGYEPQFVLVKPTSTSGDWVILDTTRGWAVTGGPQQMLKPNTTAAEASLSAAGGPNATGFGINGIWTSTTCIYVAIRKGPMKVPTSGTSVFGLNARTGTGSSTTVTGGQLADAIIVKNIGETVASLTTSRLIGGGTYLVTSSTNAQANAGSTVLTFPVFDTMDGFRVGSTSTITNATSNTYINYLFKRAPSFMDVVCYTGNGTAGRTINHNLGAVPEMMIVKSRSGAYSWQIYTATRGPTEVMTLTSDPSSASVNPWNDTAPTSTVFTVGGTNGTNSTLLATYVAYLFATCAGVSKVGSYTGTATTKQVDCGFTAGARFVLIKKTSGTGSWYVWDSARGIVSGNDPYLLLNSTAAEVTNTDYIDTYSAGFEISSTAPSEINENGGSFIFFAVA